MMAFATKNEKEKITWSDSEDSWDEFEKAKDRKCTYCTKTLQSAQDVVVHEQNCSIAKTCSTAKVTCKDGTQKFICDICCSTYKYLFKLAEHEKRHEPPGGFICKYCDTPFCTEVQLEEHTEETHKVFKCQICKDTFETADSYISHIRILHNGHDKEYKACEECGRHFKSPLILKFHKETNCGQNKRYNCDECGKTFQTNGTLKTHKLIHSGEKRFCCSFCGMKFTVKGLLTRHERTHTGEKPYSCNLCQKSFSHRDSLITHSTTHTGIKPYICECCGSRFSCTSNLIQHRRKRPETCGLPENCKKLTKACPRPGVNNPEFLTSHEPVRLFKSHRVIKSTEKEKLKEKLKAARDEKKLDKKPIRKKKRKIIIDKNNIEKSSNENNVCVEINDNNLNLCKTEVKSENVECFEENILEIPKTITTKKITKVKITDNSTSSIELRRSARIKDGKKIELIFPTPIEDDENTDIITKMGVTDTIKMEVEADPWNIKQNPLTTMDIDNDIKEEISIEPEITMNDSQTNLSNTSNNVDIKSEGDDFDCNDDYLNDNQSNDSSLETEFEDSFKSKSPCRKKTDSSKKIKNVRRPKKLLKLISKKVVNIENEPSEKMNIENEPSDKKNQIEDYENNELQSTKKQSFECYECPNKLYTRKNSYHMHLLRFHNKNEDEIKHIFDVLNESLSEYSCNICGKFYSMPKALQSHIKRHGPDGSLVYKCKTCTKYFATKDDLKLHYQNDHKDKITCTICNKIYKDSEILAAHKRKVHTTNNLKIEQTENILPPIYIDKNLIKKQIKETFICNICGKMLKSRSALNIHERSDCGKSPIFKCNVCGKALTTAGILKAHMLIHSGELPHQCSYCEKRFRQRQQLTCHERTHTGEKPYPCTYCDKAFAFVENLYIHLSTHTGIKRFMCITCGDRFSCISGLKNHWRTNATTCGSDPNRSTKAVGEYMGFQKGQLVHKKKTG